MPVYADPREIETLVVKLTNAALQCRDLGHSWRTQNVEVEGGGYKRTLKCTRGCRVVRTQRVDHRGKPVKNSNKYDYPDTGYLFGKPVGRVAGEAKDAVRLAAIYREMERIHGSDSADNMRQASRGGSGRGRANHNDGKRKGGRGASVSRVRQSVS